MKNQLEWAPVENLNEARKIARLASLAVPELQPDFDEPKIDLSSSITVADYRFVKLTDKTGRELYGFFPADFGCFIPLDKNRQAFDFLRFYLNDAYTDEINEIQNLLTDIEVAQESGIPYGNYLPQKDGEYVLPNEAIRKHTQSYYKESGIEQAWRYKLPFWNVGLLEFMFTEDDKRVTKYALFRKENDEIKHFGLLTGQSDDVYVFLSQENGLEPENMAPYLKLFCWALEANEGKFIMPETICEIAWEAVPDKARWEEIHQTIKVPNPVFPELKEGDEPLPTDDPTKPTNVIGMLAYGQGFFNAGFHVDIRTGLVTMTDDTQLLDSLPVKVLRFGTEKMPDSPTNRPKINLLILSQPEEYPQKLVEVNKSVTISSDDFLKLLRDEGRVDSKRVSGKVSIGDNSLAAYRECVEIHNCWFDDEIQLITYESATAFRFTECMFARTFSAKDCVLKKPLSFENCWFNDILGKSQAKRSIVANFENYRSEGNLIFKDCYLFGRIHACSMKLEGNLSFQSCLVAHDFFPKNNLFVPAMGKVEIEYPEKDKPDALQYAIVSGKKMIYAVEDFIDDPILYLDNSLIQGNFEISVDRKISEIREFNAKTCTIVIGNISAQGTEVQGFTSFWGTFMVGTLTFKNSTFQKNINFNEFDSDHIQFFLGSDLILDSCRISGRLNLGYGNIDGNVLLHNTHIETHVDLLASKIKENLSLQFSVIKGMLIASKASEVPFSFDEREVLQIGKNLSLSSSDIRHIRMTGVNVEGSVRIKAGHFHSIELTWGDNISSPDFFLLPFRAKNISISNVTIQENINLSGIYLNDYQLSGNPKESEKNTQNAACTVRASEIKGDLQFFGEFTFDRNNTTYTSETIITQGNLNLEANTIGGNLDLKRVRVENGHINLTHTQVKLGIDISQCFKGYSDDGTPVDPLSPSLCSDLYMTKASVYGDVFLTGLETGSIKANDAQIKGGLCLNMDVNGKSILNVDKSEARYFGKIENRLDLAATEIDWINLGIKNFPPPNGKKKKKGEEAPIILERAKINKVNILSEIPDINLSDSSISHWDIYASKRNWSNWVVLQLVFILIIPVSFILADYAPTHPSVHPNLIRLIHLYLLLWGIVSIYMLWPKYKAKRYMQILKKMKPHDESVYVAIEMALRNESKELDADRIYRAMRLRSAHEKKWFQMLLDYFWYGLTGYGTRLWLLLFIWLGLVLGTAFYISLPGNHQPVPAFTSVGACCLPDNRINPDSIPSLTTGEALLLAGKHCIPGINFPSDGKYVTAEHTGPVINVIYGTSFILLSLFGVSVTAKLIRGKQ